MPSKKSSNSALTRALPLIFTAVLMIFVVTTFSLSVLIRLYEDDPVHGTNMAIAAGIIFFFTFWAFIRVATTDPGQIPDWFNDRNSPKAKLQTRSVEKKSNGSRRYCTKCSQFKPDRAHHCRVCGRCNLKMDHHCPWVNNCIGYGNYKLFLLFIIYALTSCIFVFVTCVTFIPSLPSDVPSSIHLYALVDCIITGALSLALTAFVGFHLHLLSNNYTTIEFLEKRGCSPAEGHVNIYDQGVWGNVKMTMGPNPLLWPFPIKWGVPDQGQGTSFKSIHDP